VKIVREGADKKRAIRRTKTHMNRNTLKLFLILCVGMAAVGVSAQERPKPEVVKPPASADTPAADSPAAPVDPNTYKIGPEDVISIRTWREPELSIQAVVRPDGKITLPLAGDLTVGGLSPAEVQQKVTEMYSKYVNKPEVGIFMAKISSKKYYLVGQIQRTGAFALIVPTTVLEAINGAGGFMEYANRKKVVILRGDQRLKFNYDEVIKGKNMSQNILLENGDHVIVQ
jgi:polysaccharide export outer membrane protein